MSSLSTSNNDIQSGIQGLQTYSQVSEDRKSLKKGLGSSLSNVSSNASTQLNKIQDYQKRFQRNTPTSMDGLLDFIGGTRGNSSPTFQYLRKKVLEALTKLEPIAREIVVNESIKTLGCSDEQTYQGYSPTSNPLQFIPTLSVSDGIYIPVNSVDFLGNLKLSSKSEIGQLYYEVFEPNSESGFFKPYGGRVDYPFNKMLNLSMDSSNTNKNYTQIYNNFYNGESGQFLLDVQYTKTNDLGVTGDFFRVFLIDRNGSSSSNINLSGNTIKQFLVDYYSTIKIVELPSIIASLMNYLSNFVSIKAGFSYKRLSDESKMERIIQRILGLCNDSRREIDVSGVAKIPELDGVDESFFEFTEVDLRQIDDKINNIQLGIVKLESCGEVQLPVNADEITQQILDFKDTISGMTPQQQVVAMEKIADTFIDNPQWRPLIPNGVQANIEINKNFIKELPKAVAYSILSPKVLLPLFAMYSAIEKSAKNKVNRFIQSGNTYISSAQTISENVRQSGSTLGQMVDNIVDDAVDFFKKFKTFAIELVQKLNAEFLKILFEILKKDILNLLDVIIGDISKSAAAKKYTIFIRLIQLGLIVSKLITDYRKCKSLLDSIKNLLALVNQVAGLNNKIPNALLPLTSLLPGQSPERALLNTIKNLQELGLPTGPMPDGSANLVTQALGALIKGTDQEMSENGTIDAMVIVPPLTGGLLQVFGKQR